MRLVVIILPGLKIAFSEASAQRDEASVFIKAERFETKGGWLADP